MVCVVKLMFWVFGALVRTHQVFCFRMQKQNEQPLLLSFELGWFLDPRHKTIPTITLALRPPFPSGPSMNAEAESFVENTRVVRERRAQRKTQVSHEALVAK